MTTRTLDVDKLTVPDLCRILPPVGLGLFVTLIGVTGGGVNLI